MSNTDRSIDEIKQAQLRYVLENNPHEGEVVHTWIREVKDILTFEESLQDSDYIGWDDESDFFYDPDYADMVKTALETGQITVYSSKPIEKANFVTPDRREAENYAGGGKVYSKIVKLTDVAWLDPNQGQYCPMNELSFPQEKNRVFVDMDGTLAQFKYVALEELIRPGYYRELAPMENTVEAVKELIKRDNVEVFIMSAVLRDAHTARDEKNAWLDEYLPEVDKEHRCFMYCDEVKVDHIPGGQRDTDLLIDDYTHNLDPWSPPGIGVKLLNGINDTKGSWQGDKISFERKPLDIAERVEKISMGIEHTYDKKIQEPKPLLLHLQPQSNWNSWIDVLIVRKNSEIVLFFGHNEDSLRQKAGLDENIEIPEITVANGYHNAKELAAKISEIAQGNTAIEEELKKTTDFFINAALDSNTKDLRPIETNRVEQGKSFNDYKVANYLFNKKEPLKLGSHDQILYCKRNGAALGLIDSEINKYFVSVYNADNRLLDNTTPRDQGLIDKLMENGKRHAETHLAKAILFNKDEALCSNESYAGRKLNDFVLDDNKISYTMERLHESCSWSKIEELLRYRDGKIILKDLDLEVPIEKYPERDEVLKKAWDIIDRERERREGPAPARPIDEKAPEPKKEPIKDQVIIKPATPETPAKHKKPRNIGPDR